MSSAVGWSKESTVSPAGNSLRTFTGSADTGSATGVGKATINDWLLRYHHQQQQHQQHQHQQHQQHQQQQHQHHQHQQHQQQTCDNDQSATTTSKETADLSRSLPGQPPAQVARTSSVPAPGELEYDLLTELTESERDYQMDLGVSLVVVPPDDEDAFKSPHHHHHHHHRGQRQQSTSAKRWTAYDNVTEEDVTLGILRRRQFVDDEDYDEIENRRIAEVMHQCSEYEYSLRCDTVSQPEPETTPTIAKNSTQLTRNLRLEMPPSPRSDSCLLPTSPSAIRSTSPSSKIKTNGSLTSPVNGRRALAIVVAIATTVDASPTMTSSIESKSTKFLAPCWLETTAVRDVMVRGPNVIATEVYRINATGSAGNQRDWSDEEQPGDWSGEHVGDVTDSGYPTSERNGSQQIVRARDMSSGRVSVDRRSRERSEAESQASVLAQRMKDIEDLEEKAIREVMVELEVAEGVMTAEESDLNDANLRLNLVKEQQMELLLEAAKEREEADRHMSFEKHRLKSMERTCLETRQRLESRDKILQAPSDVTETDDVNDDVELRMTLRRQQDAVDKQRRLVDDLEFQLLELETRREAQREPLQTRLMAERTKLHQTCSMRKSSVESLYLQKLELLAQAKADVADLAKEYQLLLDAFLQEKQKLNETAVDNTWNGKMADSHVTNGFLLEGTCSDDDNERASPDSSDRIPTCTSSLSWKQGVLWRTLMELEAEIVSKRPPCADECESNDWSRQQSRDWYGESEQSNDDVSCGDLTRDRDNGISDSGNTLDESMRCDSSTQSNNDDVEDLDAANCSMLVTTESVREQENENCENTWRRPAENADSNQNLTSGRVIDSERIVYREKRSAVRQSRPLTRYLPVRDGETSVPTTFNLRQFVEAAGHVIDTSFVHVTPVACHGWLVKMAGSRRLHVWHRRYFLFDRTWRTLTWYRSGVNPSIVAPPPTSGGRCCVPFGSLCDVFVDHLHQAGRSPSPPLTFCIKSRDRQIFVVAPSAEVMRIWIDALVTGAEGYGEFR